MTKRISAVLIAATMFVTLLTIAPAQAHFERGGNCRIENISRRGTITFRVTNRLHIDAEITCRLRFNNGVNPGWFRMIVNERSWDIGRWTYRGRWTRVWITHVHVRRLYDY